MRILPFLIFRLHLSSYYFNLKIVAALEGECGLCMKAMWWLRYVAEVTDFKGNKSSTVDQVRG